MKPAEPGNSSNESIAVKTSMNGGAQPSVNFVEKIPIHVGNDESPKEERS